MKLLSKNKIIVSALALCVGASLAGSISGTIAWYQYSTRTNVSFIGKASGISSNLQMRFVSEASKANPDSYWRTRITWQEMNAELGNLNVVPVTFGAMEKDDALPTQGYVQPLVGVSDMTKWGKATNKNYAQFKLQLRNINHEGAADANDAQDVYLSKLLIQEDANNGAKKDLSDAIRVHVSSNDGSAVKNRLISNKGQDVETKGKLDIDGDGRLDQAYPDENDEFGFGYLRDNSGSFILDSSSNPTRVGLTDVIYGDDGDNTTDEIQKSYAATYDPNFGGIKYTEDEINNAQEGDDAYDKTTDDWKVEPASPALVYPDGNVLYDDGTKTAEPAAGKVVGTTLVGDAAYLEVTVTIWVEGWQKLDGNAIWDAAKYIDSSFNVGIQFAVQDRQ